MQKKEDLFKDYIFWKEYPERDTEFVRWYPPTLAEINGKDIWLKKEIGLYIHLPFCKTICKYCNFNKYVWKPEKTEEYLEALKKEIAMVPEKGYIQDSVVIALYFGGGTPTCLTIEQLMDIIRCCRDNFNISQKAEVSIEVNPETTDEYMLKTLFDKGVNRISFGVQSFNDELLKVIGRSHKIEQSISAIELAHQIGFDVINIDLLYRLPNQTLSDWEEDLNQALGLGLNHLSIYELGLEPGTKLYDEIRTGRVSPQPEDKVFIEMHDMAIQLLIDAGYHQYNQCYDFALPGKECVYNNISLGKEPEKEHIGLGAGAFSHIHGYVYFNILPLKEYIQTVNSGKIPVSVGKKISKVEEIARYMVVGMVNLRVGKSKFKEQFGVKIEDIYGDRLKKLESQGLITVDEDSVRLTHKGKIYGNNVSKTFYTEESRGKPQPIASLLKQKNGYFEY